MHKRRRLEASRERRDLGLSEEAGIIVFGGGGGSGPGCLFWLIISVILSVALTVIANLLFVVF